jgi:hypothetical protein
MVKRFRVTTLIFAGVLLAALAYVAGIAYGTFGELEGPGKITDSRVPAATIEARESSQRMTAMSIGADAGKQILFGDLHVHTTYSGDAFSQSLPIQMGEGARPLADACDFARYCSALDFWAITDHAETHTPRTWRETRQSIRQCNAVAGDPLNPDVVALLGWEWSQTGTSAATHFGHRNVIFIDTEDAMVPSRPIGSAAFPKNQFQSLLGPGAARLTWPLLDLASRQVYYDFFEFMDEWSKVPYCSQGIAVRNLPDTCTEVAATPRELFARLDQWGFDAIVIPHGTAWGHIVPPGSTWDRQLTDGNHDPRWQRLIEIYSGHGNSEEYRNWREVTYDQDGNIACPRPSDDYTPTCWRAGEIIRERCAAAGLDQQECEQRAVEARQRYLAAGNRGHHTIPGQRAEDWLDAGQCRDCFLPVFSPRPLSSVQYALATTAPAGAEGADRFRFGIIGSSDIHRARPGVGYKEFARHGMTDATGPRDAGWAKRLGYDRGEPLPQAQEIPDGIPFWAFGESERRAGYLTTGGLVAIHADGRDRQSIWKALKKKQVYATSGPRILLWFDLLNSPEGVLPMGSEARMASPPRFRARAVGSLRQKPGCPEHSFDSLGADRIARLCLGECYHPSDQRLVVTRIEIVRIRPRLEPGEPMEGLIESPWKTFNCPADPNGCTVEFDDPDFADSARDYVYYARAVQQPTPKINGGNLRCEYDEKGNCVKLNLCTGGFPTDRDDDCLAEVEERAWSSPIFVDYL